MTADLPKLTSPYEVRAALEALGVRPSKSLGQNFLIDRNIRDIVIHAAEVGAGDDVLEIGPGLGVLTECLLEQGARLTAVELDKRLHAGLVDRLGGSPGLLLHCGDALDLDWTGATGRHSRLVANLPYAPGSRILMDMFSGAALPDRVVVTVQREVAGRLTALPGTADFGLMSVWCGAVYDAELLKVVSPTCFWPVPRVESGIVVMRLHHPGGPPVDDREFFRELTRYAFMHRRKQLASALKSGPGHLRRPPDDVRSALEDAGAEPAARPSDLGPDQWCTFTNLLT